jgi:hypothetical protein
MTFLVAIAIIALAAATLAVFAGREVLRVNGFPPVRVRSIDDLLHLISLGFSALNDASNQAARRRVAGPRR